MKLVVTTWRISFTSTHVYINPYPIRRVNHSQIKPLIRVAAHYFHAISVKSKVCHSQNFKITIPVFIRPIISCRSLRLLKACVSINAPSCVQCSISPLVWSKWFGFPDTRYPQLALLRNSWDLKNSGEADEYGRFILKQYRGYFTNLRLCISKFFYFPLICFDLIKPSICSHPKIFFNLKSMTYAAKIFSGY